MLRISRNPASADSKAPAPCKDRISFCQVSEYEMVKELSDFGRHYAKAYKGGGHSPGRRFFRPDPRCGLQLYDVKVFTGNKGQAAMSP